MKPSKQGFSIVYAFLIILLVSLFGVIVLNKKQYFDALSQQYSIVSGQIDHIKSKKDYLIPNHLTYNSDGFGMLDRLECPMVSYSGSTSSSVWTNTGALDFCSGSIFSTHYEIYPNQEVNDFSGCLYGAQSFLLSSFGINRYADIDGKVFNFEKHTELESYSGSTFLDDYKWTQYTSTLEDNDDLARKHITGYIRDDFVNIFWNGKPVRTLVSSNTNNIVAGHSLLGNTQTGKVYLHVEGDFELHIVEFDRSFYESKSKLVKSHEWDFQALQGSGYLYHDMDSLTPNLTDGANFDFQNKDYAFFLKSTGDDFVYYDLQVFGADGSRVYIVPIRDDSASIEYLGYDIVKSDNSYILRTHSEVISK